MARTPGAKNKHNPPPEDKRRLHCQACNTKVYAVKLVRQWRRIDGFCTFYRVCEKCADEYINRPPATNEQ